MTWFKVDDSFHSHPKVLAADPAALGLWVIAGTWSSANLSDGFVPDHVLPRLLPGSAELAKSLVACGLWRRAKGGYRFHDWGDYNPRSDDVKKERDAARERMRNLRAKRKGTAQDEDCSGEQEANVRAKFATPTRPDPTRSSSDEELEDPTPPPPAGPPKTPPAKSRTTKVEPKGTRLPGDFTVTDEMKTWARDNAPDCGNADHDAFCDYWRSVPGAKGRKIDWPATWRNWMRREQQQRSRATKPGRTATPRPSARDQAFLQSQALREELFGTDSRPSLNIVRGELA